MLPLKSTNLLSVTRTLFPCPVISVTCPEQVCSSWKQASRPVFTLEHSMRALQLPSVTKTHRQKQCLMDTNHLSPSPQLDHPTVSLLLAKLSAPPFDSKEHPAFSS